MGRAITEKEFENALESIGNMSSETKKQQFLMTVERYNHAEIDINVLFLMALILGDKEGKMWFCEAVPFEARHKYMQVYDESSEISPDEIGALTLYQSDPSFAVAQLISSSLSRKGMSLL